MTAPPRISPTEAIALAMAGDTTLLRALLDQIAPPRRDRYIPFELPPMHRAADAVHAAPVSPCGGGWRALAARSC